MRFGLKLARYGMSMEEATIVKWHKAAGAAFKADDVLYEIETEKVTQEVQAPFAGTLSEIAVAEGQVAAVGEVVCFIDAPAPTHG